MQVQVCSSSLVPVPNHPMSDTVAAGLALVELSLDITVAGDDVVWLAVTSPAGEARQPITLPWPRAETTTRSAQLGEPAAGGGQLAATAFGSALFASLFTGAARSRYDATRALAARDRQGVRVRLRVHDPALAALPWELLYDPERGEFLALSQSSPVVRGVAQRQPQAPFAVDGPLRILALAASPASLRSLDIVAERARLEQAVALTDGAVELVWVAGATWRDLQDSLLRGPWHVFHFIGHGYYDDIDNDFALVLADAQNQAQLLGSAAAARLVADHPSLRLVVLNACQGAQAGASYVSLAQLLAERGVPAVLAMQYPIGEAAALEFARTFYTALALRRPVDVATSEARKAMSVAASATWEWATPVLFLGGDGQLWAEQKQETGIVANDDKKQAWWEQVTNAIGAVDAGGAGGDVIVATVGAGAKNVVVGKNNVQRVTEVLGQPQPDDRAEIAAGLEQLNAALARLTLTETEKARAEVRLEILRDELTNADAAPDGDMLAKAGDWLLQNLPALTEALGAFFALPAVGRALGEAGSTALNWAVRSFPRRRMG
jgi:hypothetical protein